MKFKSSNTKTPYVAQLRWSAILRVDTAPPKKKGTPMYHDQPALGTLRAPSHRLSRPIKRRKVSCWAFADSLSSNHGYVTTAAAPGEAFWNLRGSRGSQRPCQLQPSTSTLAPRTMQPLKSHRQSSTADDPEKYLSLLTPKVRAGFERVYWRWRCYFLRLKVIGISDLTILNILVRPQRLA